MITCWTDIPERFIRIKFQYENVCLPHTSSSPLLWPAVRKWQCNQDFWNALNKSRLRWIADICVISNSKEYIYVIMWRRFMCIEYNLEKSILLISLLFFFEKLLDRPDFTQGAGYPPVYPTYQTGKNVYFCSAFCRFICAGICKKINMVTLELINIIPIGYVATVSAGI